jgi:hypothetical protein
MAEALKTPLFPVNEHSDLFKLLVVDAISEFEDTLTHLDSKQALVLAKAISEELTL